MRCRQLWGTLLALTIGGATTPAAAVPLISIVIDDLGDSWAEGQAAIALPGAVACAFLPESPHTRRLAELAHAARKEILVHLPLEPVAGRAHPLALSAQLATPQRSDWLGEMLAAVPYATGVNNHQGSLATSNRGAMHWLMRELSLRSTAFFIDSMTSTDSVAYPLARAYGIPATRRRVFLDHQRGEAETHAQFQRLVRIAKETGGALAIGHPYPETLKALAQLLPQLDGLGVALVEPSVLIRRVERQPPPLPMPLRMATTLSPAPEPALSAGAMP
ncbi:divergent polysaccharide deacetylase family protein [Fontimonas sp. SYSU GA230001]|uniref:divergent polysaccharide deacetylase family protein n=1 Tax=Fontimonas sp. SYSU GA230001 TaxID=3142450 RepID=UPI0032B4AE5B